MRKNRRAFRHEFRILTAVACRHKWRIPTFAMTPLAHVATEFTITKQNLRQLYRSACSKRYYGCSIGLRRYSTWDVFYRTITLILNLARDISPILNPRSSCSSRSKLNLNPAKPVAMAYLHSPWHSPWYHSRATCPKNKEDLCRGYKIMG